MLPTTVKPAEDEPMLRAVPLLLLLLVALWAMLAGRASSASCFALFLVVTRPRVVATAAAPPR